MRLTSLVCAVSLFLGGVALAGESVERKTVGLGGSAPRGTANAPVSLVVFSDFECPFCSKLVPTLRELETKNKGQLRISFRQLPLPFHKNARLAAVASLAAGEQGKFWEMHDLLFAQSAGLGREALIGYAKSLTLDVPRFVASLDSGRFDQQLAADEADAAKVGAQGTPTVFINGRVVVGAQPAKAFQDIINEELASR